MRLLNSVGLFDGTYRLPSNPWLQHGDQGITAFHQSYHSVYKSDYTQHTNNPRFFREWLKHACRYQPPRPDDGSDCYLPFTQYGGTPVEADFTPHRVERPRAPKVWLGLQRQDLFPR